MFLIAISSLVIFQIFEAVYIILNWIVGLPERLLFYLIVSIKNNDIEIQYM